CNVMKTLNLMGYDVKSVKTIKTYEITIGAKSKDDAERKIKEICEKLLANPVIQNYRYHLIEK
ncbi:MAG: phosphoribosylformylglycinamidine synthase subunit PurS, partial [Thermoplasmata archaeon]